MKTFLLVIAGWIGGYLLGSGFLKLLEVFGVEVADLPFFLKD